ncbi:hypothetical protein GALL_397400 [mine drainage metagenome]|uniref:Uncharacterized protein n=1 Tax=mine drainage metagenome TaxID=410659 RepID=A0A1J5Q495_9ZZZZ
MPVLFVKASNDALGGASMKRATVIVEPAVLSVAELELLPPPEHAVTMRLKDAIPATNAVLFRCF